MRRGIAKPAFALIAALTLTLGAPAFAADKLDLVSTFSSGDETALVLTYRAENGGKLGIISFNEGDDHRSLGLATRQWLDLKGLIETALDTEGPPWRKVGNVAETGVDNPSTVAVFSGPDRIRFTVDAPNKKTMTYELKPSNEYEFLAAITQVKHWLLTD